MADDTTTDAAEARALTDAQLKDAVTELLSHRGEDPYWFFNTGQQYWETWLPAFRAAMRYLPATAEAASGAGKRITIAAAGYYAALSDDGRKVGLPWDATASSKERWLEFADIVLTAASGAGEREEWSFTPDTREAKVVAQLSEEQELSPQAVMRQALRLYQSDFLRRKAGETVTWSGDAQRARDFAGPLASLPPATDPAMLALKNLADCADSVAEALNTGLMDTAIAQARAALPAAPTIPATGEGGWTKAGRAWLAAGAPPIPATGHAATEGEGA
jgi:hypothetical protein